MRGVAYKNKVNRSINKLIQRVKWLPLLKKSQIFEKTLHAYFETKS